jgi:hypothetical protein
MAVQSATTLASELAPSELKALVKLLAKAKLAGAHLEIGTAAGGTLKALMLCYPAAQRPQFVVVDTFGYFPNQRETVKQNLRSAGIDPATVDFREGSSWDMQNAALKGGDSFSFILIDAVHSIVDVTRDLRWTRLLAVGGYVCIHDYGLQFRGVLWAVRWFLFRHPQYELITVVGTLAIIRKVRPAKRPEVSEFDLATINAIDKVRNYAF